MNTKIKFFSAITILVIVAVFYLLKIREEPYNIKNSLVYFKADNGKSFNGFIIGQKDDTYYILTSKHSVEKALWIRAVPYLLSEEKKVNPKDFGVSSILTSNSNNDLSVTVKKNLNGIDVSIVSINTNKKLKSIRIGKDILKNNDKFAMYSFITCGDENDTNKEFFYHELFGRTFAESEFKGVKGEKLLITINEKEKENIAVINETDMKYIVPSKLGTSGSPLVNNLGNVVGVQSASIEFPRKSNCTIQPNELVSYGVSMKKILSSSDFPEDIKNLIVEN